MRLDALLAVCSGGAIGAGLRYIVGLWFVQRFGPGIPLGTFFINISGAFVIGIIAQLAETRALGVTPIVRFFVAVGVLGGFTTFSSFAYEAVTLSSEGAPLLALAYCVTSVVCGYIAAYAGIVVGRLANSM